MSDIILSLFVASRADTAVMSKAVFISFINIIHKTLPRSVLLKLWFWPNLFFHGAWLQFIVLMISNTTKNYIILSSNKLKVNKNIQIAPIVQLYVRVYSKQLNVYLSRTFLYKSSLLLKALDAKHTLAIQARWYVVERVQITD